jgi:ribosome-associated heat shock protein Hsp15
MEVRVDKYLFAMRIYKTRSIATDACKCGRIKMNGIELKPSRVFHIGDIFTVRKGPITYTYRIIQLTENRVGAKLVANYIEDITPKEQLEILELARYAAQTGRGRGTGRPTKKDIREILIARQFDLLIDLTQQPSLTMQYMAMDIQADFKVGRFIHEGIHDMTIDTAPQEAPDYLFEQIVKYIKMFGR